MENYGLYFVIAAIVLFVIVFVATRFKRCPSNRILVIFGKTGGERSARCIHGGGAFVIPLVQDFAFLDLSPRTIEIDLIGALSKKNIRVNVPSTFTVGISVQEKIMTNAAERLLGLTDKDIREQAKDIILGQMRLVIATLSIEEINQDRDKFLTLVNDNVGTELQKIGLEVINVNIRDITDESGYIEAIGKQAAAAAVNEARVNVAQEDQKGAVGEAEANRVKEVRVAEELASTEEGRKAAERSQRIALAKLEAQAVQGQKEAERDQRVAVSRAEAEATEGQKQAERDQRMAVAELEATAVTGENTSRAVIAGSAADLAEKEAEAKRRADIARANSERDILEAEKEQELARLRKEEVAREEVERLKVEIAAEAEAEKARRVAQGEADAILAKRTAEAEGLQKLLDAKATGYRNLIRACGDDSRLAPTFLLVEKLEGIVSEQVKAIQNLQIDKITVWDGGRGGEGGSSTANFLSGLIGSLPALHDLAEQAGIELPPVLGQLKREAEPVAEVVRKDEEAGGEEKKPPSRPRKS